MQEEQKHITRQEADRLIVDYYEFATRRGRIFAQRSKLSDIDDYGSEATMGLIRAARNYDPGRGNGFAAYAGAVIDDKLSKKRSREWAYRSRESSTYMARSAGVRRSGNLRSDEDEITEFSSSRGMCEPDHADRVGDHLDAIRQVELDLSKLSNPRHKEAYLSRIRGDTVNEIADRMGVHETTVRRWLWNLQGRRAA